MKSVHSVCMHHMVQVSQAQRETGSDQIRYNLLCVNKRLVTFFTNLTHEITILFTRAPVIYRFI